MTRMVCNLVSGLVYPWSQNTPNVITTVFMNYISWILNNASFIDLMFFIISSYYQNNISIKQNHMILDTLEMIPQSNFYIYSTFHFILFLLNHPIALHYWKPNVYTAGNHVYYTHKQETCSLVGLGNDKNHFMDTGTVLLQHNPSNLFHCQIAFVKKIHST